MKKLCLIISLLFAISFASASDFSDILAELDSSLVILVALFLISFSLSFFALNKIFKSENSAMAGVISGVIAFLVVYGINKTGLDTESFFLNLGVSEASLSLIIFLIIATGIVFMFVTLKKTALFILGALLIGVSLFVYAKALLMTVGIMLIIAWFFIAVSKKRNPEKHHLSKAEAKRYTD